MSCCICPYERIWKRLGRADLRCTGVARRGRYPLECFSTVNLVLKIRVIISVTHPPLWRSISAMNCSMLFSLLFVVGVRRLELPASASRTQRSTRLSYTPIENFLPHLSRTQCIGKSMRGGRYGDSVGGGFVVRKFPVTNAHLFFLAAQVSRKSRPFRQMLPD